MFNPLKFVARTMLSAIFIGGGINQLKGSQQLAPVVDAAASKYKLDLPVASKDLVTLNGAGMVTAGAALALGIKPRMAALALAGMLLPTNVVGHPFWEEKDPQKQQEAAISFVSNISTMGGLLYVAFGGKAK